MSSTVTCVKSMRFLKYGRETASLMSKQELLNSKSNLYSKNLSCLRHISQAHTVSNKVNPKLLAFSSHSLQRLFRYGIQDNNLFE